MTFSDNNDVNQSHKNEEEEFGVQSSGGSYLLASSFFCLQRQRRKVLFSVNSCAALCKKRYHRKNRPTSSAFVGSERDIVGIQESALEGRVVTAVPEDRSVDILEKSGSGPRRERIFVVVVTPKNRGPIEEHFRTPNNLVCASKGTRGGRFVFERITKGSRRSTVPPNHKSSALASSVMAKKKVLLMGKAHSGKTSMRSIIFANYLARETTRLSPTLDVEHHHVRFLGDLVLNLWDCGGQDAFYESYFERDRETIFRSVELLIYVFDIESESAEKDFDHFCGVLEAIFENSPDARIFVLVHKMDLVAEEDRESILEDRKRLIADSCRSCGVEHFECFGTSIWDETLYKAWSEIVTNLIPNIALLETHLNNFCRMCDADEVVLFERATFLVIAQAQGDDAVEEDGTVPTSIPTSVTTGRPSTGEDDLGSEDPTQPVSADQAIVHRKRQMHFDPHRYEKISNIVKQFKLSCGKAQSQFQGMEVRNSRFRAVIDAFTANTYVMVIVSNPEVQTKATEMNIHNAKHHFEKFIPRI